MTPKECHRSATTQDVQERRRNGCGTPGRPPLARARGGGCGGLTAIVWPTSERPRARKCAIGRRPAPAAPSKSCCKRHGQGEESVTGPRCGTREGGRAKPQTTASPSVPRMRPPLHAPFAARPAAAAGNHGERGRGRRLACWESCRPGLARPRLGAPKGQNLWYGILNLPRRCSSCSKGGGGSGSGDGAS